MTSPDFKLEDFLPYKLSLAANAVSRRIAKTYAPYKLSPTQWRVMAVLVDGTGMTAVAVAEKTGMDKTTISRAVNKMLDRGLVNRCASDIDGRAAPLSLSKTGMVMFDKIAPQVLAQERELKAVFTDTELQRLEGFLSKLKNQP